MDLLMEMIRKVKETVRKHSMLAAGDRVLIGLSGGPDSVCLAVVLSMLKEDLSLSLSAVYVDHGLRPDEVGREADFCRRFCEEHEIAFMRKTAPVKDHAAEKGLNLQEAARELRYTALEEAAEQVNASRIAVGHNADDQAETVLMRLMRGSGRKGLAGIPPIRDRIIRPLIDIKRCEIEEFLLRKKGSSAIPELLTPDSELLFMVDSSNLKQDYFRNWIRSTFMGEMKKRNPSVVDDICRTAEILREEDDYLEIVVTKTLMRLISRKSDHSIELFLTPLGAIEKPVLRRVLRRAVSAVKGLRGIAFVHIEDIMKLIKGGGSGDTLDLPGGIRVIKDYSLLKITTEAHVRIGEYELRPDSGVEIKEANLIIKASLEEKGGEPCNGKRSVLLDAGAMEFPLRVRPRQEGDFFYPLGFGKRKKLQDFLVDEKVQRDKRDEVPIVVSGNDIIWVAGHRADDRYKVTDKTEKFLRLELNKIV